MPLQLEHVVLLPGERISLAGRDVELSGSNRLAAGSELMIKNANITFLGNLQIEGPGRLSIKDSACAINDANLILRSGELRFVRSEFRAVNCGIVVENGGTLAFRQGCRIFHLESIPERSFLRVGELLPEQDEGFLFVPVAKAAHLQISDCSLKSSPHMNWSFELGADVSLSNVRNRPATDNHPLWLGFKGDARGRIENIEHFGGTLSLSCKLDIIDVPSTFIEFIFPEGTKMSEALALPPAGDVHYHDPKGMELHVRGPVRAVREWGVTVLPNSDVRLRDCTAGLTLSLGISSAWNHETIVFDDLPVGNQAGWSKTWRCRKGEIHFSLENGRLNPASPFARGIGIGLRFVGKGPGDLLEMADNKFSSGRSAADPVRCVYRYCRPSRLAANRNVRMALFDSEVTGDVAVEAGGFVRLADSRVHGVLAAKAGDLEHPGGRVTVSRGAVRGEVFVYRGAHVTLDNSMACEVITVANGGRLTVRSADLQKGIVAHPDSEVRIDGRLISVANTHPQLVFTSCG